MIRNQTKPIYGILSKIRENVYTLIITMHSELEYEHCDDGDIHVRPIARCPFGKWCDIDISAKNHFDVFVGSVHGIWEPGMYIKKPKDIAFLSKEDAEYFIKNDLTFYSNKWREVIEFVNKHKAK